MITPEEILETIERSHEAIKKLIEKGQRVERYTYQHHATDIGVYHISVFKVEMSNKREMKVVFNGVNLWDLFCFDATKEQIERFKELSKGIWNTLHETHEEQNSEEFKLKELDETIRRILTPINLRGPHEGNSLLPLPTIGGEQ